MPKSIKLLYVLIGVIGFFSCCPKQENKSKQNNQFLLECLPNNKERVLSEEHVCFDVYDNQQVQLDKELEVMGFKYYSFYFDTIINRTKLIFSYRIIGSLNEAPVRKRLLENLNSNFQEMAETVTIEPKEKSCLYAQLTDSLKISAGKLIYSRYTGATFGGAGALETLKKYKLTKAQLKSILSDSIKISDSSFPETHLTLEKYF